MQQLDTEFELENTLACAISEWFETGYVSLYKYPEKFHDAIWSQAAIGWKHIFTCRITKTAKGRLKMDYISEASIVETCLQMMIDLWEMRNKEVYGKEEVTKQKKRKEKAAISVR